VVEVEVGERREDQRSHPRRWQTGLTRICGGDGTVMAVEAEVGERREDQRSHARRWQTGQTRICGGDRIAMAKKRYVVDLWKARSICGGGGMAKAEQQNGAMMAARTEIAEEQRKRKGEKRKTREMVMVFCSHLKIVHFS
jgi:hypothetical protein